MSIKETSTDFESSAEANRNPLESGTFCNIFRELSSLSSQMQMMSDSLAACKQMSKHRPRRKMYSMKGKLEIAEKSPQDSVQILLSPNQRITECSRENNEENDKIVSYMVGSMPPETKGSENDFENDSNANESKNSERVSSNQMSESLEEMEETFEESSTIHFYDYKKIDTFRMINVIKRELKTLVEIAPPVGTLVSAFGDNITHYKECDKCNEKISPVLPAILYRIQELIKYVTTRQQGNYYWPDDNSYLCLRANESPKAGGPKEKPKKFWAKSEKFDATLFREEIPGIQLLLEVKPKKVKKKIFATAKSYSEGPWNTIQNISIVEPNESESVSVAQVLKKSHKPRILLQKKRETVVKKNLGHLHRLLLGYPISFSLSLLFLTPVAGAERSQIEKPKLHPQSNRPAFSASEKSELEDFCYILSRDYQKKNNTVCGSENRPRTSNVKNQHLRRNILAHSSDIVKEFLREAEKEKMYDQKVQNVETGVKKLKNMVTEVQRNQVALSKILLERNIHSPSILKLTDPSMLDKESNLIRQTSNIETIKSPHVSITNLQMTVDDLIEKCGLKNRMITTILKGLRSDIPKEWWEDMMDCFLNESKPIEDIDPEKLNEFIEQTSRFSEEEEKKSKPRPQELQKEEPPSEEEPKMKGIEGEDFEKKLKNTQHCGEVKKNITSLLDCGGFPANFLLFPTIEQTDFSRNSIRKLENQVSLLNTQNERLWHEIHDLRNLFKTTVRDFKEKRIHRFEPDHQPLTSRLPQKTSGKTINLTIQIVDKDFHQLKDVEFPIRFSEMSVKNRESTENPAVKYRRTESPTDMEKLQEYEHLRNVTFVATDPKFSIGPNSGRRQSENDLNYLEDTFENFVDYREENDRLRSVLKESIFGQSSDRLLPQFIVTSSQFPRSERIYREKPVVWVPPKYMLPGERYGHEAGPSRRRVEVGYVPEKPSLMKLAENRSEEIFSLIANERELQTIPENDNSPTTSSKDITKEIQKLRTRVRSIHKDVTVLKSKNERIDKLLDRLMMDAAESTQSFEEIKHDFNRLKDQLL